MKIAHFTDTHFSPLSHIPASRSIDYHEHIKSKIQSFIKMVHEESCDLVCHSGDIFHLKASSRYTPEDINYYADIFSELKVPVLSIPGNHDLQRSSYDNYDKSAYRTFVASARWTDISYTWTKFNDKGVQVNIYGLPYKPLSIFKQELLEANEQAGKEEGLNIVLVHCDALPINDLDLFWEVMSFENLCEIGSNFHIFLQGHIHQSFPIFKTNISGGIQAVSKPWSFMRTQKDYFSTTDILEIQHKPAWTLINIASDYNVDLSYKNIECTPFEVAFNKDTLHKQVEDSQKVKSFMESIKAQYGNSNPFKIDTADNILEDMSISKEVMECLHEYLTTT